MHFRPAILPLTLLLLAAAAAADEPTQKKIRKEPPLHDNARYALLTFGPKAQTRVWLIIDGDLAYIDRNANGDLTDPGERAEARKLPAAAGTTSLSFNLGQVADADGKTKYEVSLSRTSDREARELTSLSVRINGQLTQEVAGTFGGFSLAKRPQDAPVVPFNGPLTITLRPDFERQLFYALDLSGEELKPLLPNAARRDRLGIIIAVVGTPIPNTPFFVTNQCGGVPDAKQPVAILEFNARDPARPTIRAKAVPRGHSCADGYLGAFELPQGASDGPARLTLSFDDWQDAFAPEPMRSSKVTPATLDVNVSRDHH
jgi:hypothetical protein